MRARATPAEKRFRVILEDCCRALRTKFIFQEIFVNKKTGRNYIADFYVPAFKTVFEIDGGYHQTLEQAKSDLARDKYFIGRKTKVIRILNEQTKDRDYCIGQILIGFRTQIKRKRMIDPQQIDRKNEVKKQIDFISENDSNINVMEIDLNALNRFKRYGLKLPKHKGKSVTKRQCVRCHHLFPENERQCPECDCIREIKYKYRSKAKPIKTAFNSEPRIVLRKGKQSRLNHSEQVIITGNYG